jgi:hypothetical protein
MAVPAEAAHYGLMPNGIDHANDAPQTIEDLFTGNRACMTFMVKFLFN